jgi:serpin B
LTVANGMWVQSGYPITAAFHDLLATGFHAEAAPADFQKDPAEACRRINAWMKTNTDGRVTSILDDIPPATRLVLANAVAMKAAWQMPFRPESTVTAAFYPQGSPAVQTATMRRQGPFGYAHIDDLKLLEMRYRGGRLSMVILLPDRKDGLSDLEGSLTAQRLTTALAKLEWAEVDVSLPRFSVESAASLNAALEALGMQTAFSQNADLSGIDGSQRLAIGLIAHRAMVKVDEQGTEAAAGTAAVMAMKAGPSATPEVFQADHPFLFLVRDIQTGAIWFMGRCMKP